MKGKKEAAYWALRAVEDLAINSNKSALKDAKRHLEWSIQKIEELQKGETTQ